MRNALLLLLALILFTFLNCSEQRKNDQESNVQNDTDNSITVTNTIPEKDIFPKTMYINKLSILNIWSKPGNLYYTSDLVIQIPYSEPVIVKNKKLIGKTYWSEIEFNNYNGFVPSEYLEGAIENCVLINDEKINLFEGTYYYDHINVLLGTIDNQEKIEKNNKENFIEIKSNYLNDFLMYSHYLNIEIVNINVFSTPDNFNEIISVDSSGNVKPVYYEYYFIENGLVHRYTEYSYDENTRVEKDELKYEAVYLKK